MLHSYRTVLLALPLFMHLTTVDASETPALKGQGNFAAFSFKPTPCGNFSSFSFKSTPPTPPVLESLGQGGGMTKIQNTSATKYNDPLGCLCAGTYGATSAIICSCCGLNNPCTPFALIACSMLLAESKANLRNGTCKKMIPNTCYFLLFEEVIDSLAVPNNPTMKRD
ncbi:MAG: hypothetical protein NTX86_03550 [Candidatus Dependentiae bacterium]|nr:hypothetical protein [Candidatus Dependentiae bacterium]